MDTQNVRPEFHHSSTFEVHNGVLQEKLDDCEENVLQETDSDVKGTVLQEFYRDTNIFITGGTGFMGKVLIEKLLRSCPIKKIYIMVRGKKGKSATERMDEITDVPLFDRLKRERPEFKTKLHAVVGDMALIGLGIGDEDRRHLNEEVHVVFHAAATVRFDEKLSLAINMNVRGTRELITLCRSFKNLKSFVHVSTAYGNCPREEIGECFYPTPMKSDVAIKMAEATDPQLLDMMTIKILGDWPNTYVFTKLLSEDVVQSYGQDLPIGVFRPGIVISTSVEPIPGWIDNLYGPSGVIAGVSSGLVRTMMVDLNAESNVVPCDLTCNSIIASAWDIAENRSGDIPFYNYVAPKENKLIWTTYMNLYMAYAIECATSRAIWYPLCVFTNSYLVYLIYRLFLHFLPGLVMDVALLITGKQPSILKMYMKIHRFMDVIRYFSDRVWTFRHSNVDRLWMKLDSSDQQMFDFDIMNLNWTEFVDRSVHGMRTHLLKEKPETLDAAVPRMRRLRTLHYSLVFTLCCLMTWIVWTALNAAVNKIIVSRTINSMLSIVV